MSCSSCAERRALAMQMMRNMTDGRAIGPQLAAFNATVVRDIQGMQAAISPSVAALKARLGVR